MGAAVGVNCGSNALPGRCCGVRCRDSRGRLRPLDRDPSSGGLPCILKKGEFIGNTF